MYKHKIFTRVVLAVFIIIGLNSCDTTEKKDANMTVKLSFSDNKPEITNLDEINQTLKAIGVRVSELTLPEEAESILEASNKAALTPEQTTKILEYFALDRDALLDQVAKAGRTPVIAGGGSLSTHEEGVPPYPKVYDMKAMGAEGLIAAQVKFGKLHVNSADGNVGVDEVMSLVSGGPWTWFFWLPDNSVAKLSMSRVASKGFGWRISYPGLIPHGAFMDAEEGLCVAYIYGPEVWEMRYKAPGIKGADALGSNPWVDFSTDTPVLR